MGIQDKIIVITGGTSGIGLELVKLLSPKNQVIVLARHLEKIKNSDFAGKQIQTYACDLANRGDVDKIADEILKRYPAVDILINNAAIQYTPRFLDENFDLDSVDRETAVNFTSVCRLTYHLLPSLLKPSRSLVLNVNSGLALTPKADSAVYCATKAALNSLSLSLGYQLEETNIRVLQAFMPLVDTPMTEGRGSGKISAREAAQGIIAGLENERPITDIGKVGFLRALLRLSPGIARKIMKGE